MSRLLYRVPINSNQDYLRDQTRDEYRVDSINRATIISSSLGDGSHAPCFDVDIPSAITGSVGSATLWLDAKTSERSYLRLLEELKAAGWVDSDFNPSTAELKKKERLALYHLASEKSWDYSSIWDSCTQLSGEFLGGIEALIEVGRGISSLNISNQAVSMKNPWAFPLVYDIDTLLAPSSTPGHNHLYVERPLGWEEYQSLLERFVEAAIVEPGYLGASVARQGTNLRRPGYFKGRVDQDYDLW